VYPELDMVLEVESDQSRIITFHDLGMAFLLLKSNTAFAFFAAYHIAGSYFLKVVLYYQAIYPVHLIFSS